MQGYITSDCGAVNGVQNAHHYTNNSDDTCNVTLSAGMVRVVSNSLLVWASVMYMCAQDIDCGSFLDKGMAAAIEHGVLSVSTVDTALQHQFAVQVCDA